MLNVALFMLLFTFFYIQLESTIPVLSKQVLGASAASFIFILNALIVIFFQMSVSKWACKENSKMPIILSFVLFGFSFILLHSLEYSYFYLFLAVMLFSFTEIIIQIRLDYDATNIDERLIASAYGVMSLSSAFGGIAGSYLSSLFYNQEVFGLSVWQILSIVSLSVALLSLLILKKQAKREIDGKAYCTLKSSSCHD
ncbi:hypothetical protein MCQ_01290 [Candidatus Bartonella washoeensis Sb944nv]|uniref:Major facilitator superfamily (MFS) profile domain-containing protein n=2 Tax=Candidatus Bartonella washoeensis TaxID=186739 RepID=J0Q0H9_9HYPH|nr:hypothetical protein MCQ_01290 [Bartonella washoeensis Sb944nv]